MSARDPVGATRPDLDGERLIAGFQEAVEAIERLVQSASPAQLDAASTCQGWSVFDILRHVRGCVRVWNERLDLDDRGVIRPLVIDFSKLSDEQVRQVNRLRRSGRVVVDMTEENTKTIRELTGESKDRLAEAFCRDADRLVQRIADQAEPNFMYYVVELQLHAHDLATSTGTQHTPSDSELIALIWYLNDPTIDLTNPWPSVLTASGRDT
jgi:hypothetical protein